MARANLLFVVFLALLPQAVLPGCTTSEPPAGMISTVENPGLTERQLRIELNDLLALNCGLLEEGANRVMVSTTDPAVWQNTLRLKANATSMFQGAAFNSDPVIGLLDLWASVIQARQFLESPIAERELREGREIALESNTRIVQATEELAGRLVQPEELDELREIVVGWAEEHPIKTLSMARPSAAAALIEMTTNDSRGAFDVIHDLSFQVDALTERLQVYASMLPKQSRWQAEMVVYEALRGEEVTQLRADLHSIDESVKRVTQVVEDAQEILATEREAVFAGVTEQREEVVAALTMEREEIVAVLAVERAIVLAALSDEREILVEAVSEQRRETLDALAEERAVILDSVDVQRLATLEAITREREEVLRFVDREREIAAAEAEHIASSSLKQGFDRAGELADRLLTRLAIYGAIGLSLCFLGALALMRIRRRASA